LSNVVDLASRKARKDHSRQVPESIKDDMDAQAVFGVVEPVLKTFANGDASDDDAASPDDR
jgi:type I restriction enzyme R subunit